MGQGVKPEAKLIWNEEHTLFWSIFVFVFSDCLVWLRGAGMQKDGGMDCYIQAIFFSEEDSNFFPLTCELS